MPDVSPVPRAADLIGAVEHAFADAGPLARALPAFEPRPGQRAMARAVAEALAGGGVLLAEAGTGTGKTLAYLVPAILSRQRVLVSTGTRTLQEQIYTKDLPLLADALGMPVTAACMKGRNNYLCLHRFAQVRASLDGEAQVCRVRRHAGPLDRRASREAPEPSLEAIDPALVRRLAIWSQETETGDRAELADLPEDLPFWQAVSATSETCLGAECPRHDDCFVTRMRQRAAVSDVVIVNHHLLCADAAVRQGEWGEVIPPCPHVVVDEAHQLEDVATQYFGLAVSGHRLEDLVRDTARLLGRTIADRPGDVRRAVTRLDDHARAFFSRLALAWQGRAPGEERVRVRAEWFAEHASAGLAVAGALAGLEAALALAAGAGPEGASPDGARDATALARRAGALRLQLEFLVAANDPAYVYFLEGRARSVALRAAPIDVSHIVRELLIEDKRASVLTSATLSVGGSFEYVRARLGIGEATQLRVPSEFDYARQAVLYLPRHMPEPRATTFADAVAREAAALVRRSRGRAFLLFTSHAMLHAVHERLRSVIDYPLLVQGAAPRPALLDAFRTTPHAVLLATSSFWQGVDVAGEQLSLVVIDKLPFASPADPITAARIEALTERGGDPFHEYQVPVAILTLLQGLGRLIRHRRDRGVLAVLDPRLLTRGYGRRFLAALPPAPITHSLDDVERFFGEW